MCSCRQREGWTHSDINYYAYRRASASLTLTDINRILRSSNVFDVCCNLLFFLSFFFFFTCMLQFDKMYTTECLLVSLIFYSLDARFIYYSLVFFSLHPSWWNSSIGVYCRSHTHGESI